MSELKVTLPESWKDVTLDTFMELNSIDANGKDEFELFVEQLSVLTNTDPDDIKKLSLVQLNEMMMEMSFINLTPKNTVKTFEIKDVEYGFIPDLNRITLGEWVDLEEWINEGVMLNLHKITAVLYRPITSKTKESILKNNPLAVPYVIEEYSDQTILHRAELFRTTANVEEVFGAVVFFSPFVLEYLKALRDYSLKKAHQMLKETMMEDWTTQKQ